MKISVFSGLLLLCGVLLIIGCSSSERVANSQDVRILEPSEGSVSKVTITTDYSSTMPSTVITFTIPESGHVFIEVTNATGYSIKVLVDGELEAGSHEILWKVSNDDGDVPGPGIYYLHLGGPDGGLWYPLVMGEL